MLKVIRSLLLKIVDDIDAGNSNITEGEAIEIVDNLRRFTDKEKRLSKYAACEYLNVSRATFDNYVREGKLPRGKHEIGFKELSWNKKTLDEFIARTIWTICRFSTSVFCAVSSLSLFCCSVIFSRVFWISRSRRSSLLIAIIKILLSLCGLVPIHQPVPFDTFIGKGIALDFAGVAGIALNGINAASVGAYDNAYMVCAPV